jgi:chorismate mutase
VLNYVEVMSGEETSVVEQSDGQSTVIEDVHNANPKLTHVVHQIQQLRITIDELDANIIQLLAQRFAVTDQVGQLKAEASFAPADPAREIKQVESLRFLAQQCGLDSEIAEKYLTFVTSISKERHARFSQQ